MLERTFYFLGHRLGHAEGMSLRIMRGELDSVRKDIEGASGHAGRRGSRRPGQRSPRPRGRRGDHGGGGQPRAQALRARPLSWARSATTPPSSASSARCSASSGPSTTCGTSGRGAKGSASQQTVMAGISEALVATAVGLFVAIPAVVAYNAFNALAEDAHRTEPRPSATPWWRTCEAGASRGPRRP